MRSAQEIRNDPTREKTPADLRAIAAAKVKRKRKLARNRNVLAGR